MECPKCPHCGKKVQTIIVVEEIKRVWDEELGYDEETTYGYVTHAYCKKVLEQWVD